MNAINMVVFTLLITLSTPIFADINNNNSNTWVNVANSSHRANVNLHRTNQTIIKNQQLKTNKEEWRINIPSSLKYARKIEYNTRPCHIQRSSLIDI
ncbi:hypothetical protein L4D09_25140 [Photobacterium makurazakiensis]|uniref:hypothetical protein n=1 Tax=Photobacterium makurazakiensis TaxID=2910234 RepID=UPI003D14D9B5